jgi:hypothetical protein
MNISKFEIGDTIVDPENIVYDILEMPTRSKIMGSVEAKGCVLVLRCHGCKFHKIPTEHRFGIFDGASVYYNNIHFRKVEK